MKTLGIIGGISPASTEIYYRAINQAVSKRCGEHHSGRLMINSVNFAEVRAMQEANEWARAGEFMADAASRLGRGGVDGVLLACNTMHRCADAMEAALDVPFLHIADATRARLDADGRHQTALLGTLTTMDEDFIKGRLGEHVRVPGDADRAFVDDVIFNELAKNEIRDESRDGYIAVCQSLKADGADSVVLGCTEVGMLLNAENCPLPVYDTALIHVDAAVDFILGSDA